MLRHPPHVVAGFTGRSKSGKTTIAHAVKERLAIKYRLPCVFVSKFADPLREMLRSVGVEKGDLSHEWPHPFFRTAAQHIGQMFRSQCDENFWVQLAVTNVIGGKSAPSIILFDDLRYLNESEICDVTVQLVTARPNGLSGAEMCHPSEKEWEQIRPTLAYNTDDALDIDRIATNVSGHLLELWEANRAS